MTNLHYLNDSTEFFFFRNKVRDFIGSKLQQNPKHEGYSYLETILRQDWQREIYCACFSEHSDLLSQWRAYGDDGRGFAIGFSTEHLQWLSTQLQGKFADVIYDHKKQEALIEWAFDLPPQYDGEEQKIEEATGTVLGNISEAACRCKSKAFFEEAEWRICCEPITVLDEDHTLWSKATVPRYIDRRGLITPYIEIPLTEGMGYTKRGMEPIKEIVFGPKNNSIEQQFAVTRMLESRGFKRVNLVKSTATNYR